VSDKPAWIQALPTISPTDLREIRMQYRKAVREANGIDQFVKSIYEAMDPNDTVLFFVSDNGFSWGHHDRWPSATDPVSKYDMYDTSLHVPLVAYGYGFKAGTTTQPVNIQDITKTIVVMSGATAPYTLAGVDLRDVQNNPSSYNSRELLHQVRQVKCPDADAITTMTRKLVRYHGDVDGTLNPDVGITSNNITVTGAATVWQAVSDASDASYVTGADDTPASFTVGLANPAVDPTYEQMTEPITLHWRAQAIGGIDAVVTVDLLQTSTIIWSESGLMTNGTIFDYEGSTPLTQAQAESITDWTNLRLRFTQFQQASMRMRVYKCWLEYPTVTYEAYDLDTDPGELVNWAADSGRLTERNALEAALDALL
jgi:arylsulfatase A-like enzyme